MAKTTVKIKSPVIDDTRTRVETGSAFELISEIEYGADRVLTEAGAAIRMAIQLELLKAFKERDLDIDYNDLAKNVAVRSFGGNEGAFESVEVYIDDVVMETWAKKRARPKTLDMRVVSRILGVAPSNIKEARGNRLEFEIEIIRRR